VGLCFDDERFLSKCEYYQTIERARGGVELREYWHSVDLSGVSQRASWAGLRSVAMTKNTITKAGQTTVQVRYFISSLGLDGVLIARAIRKHWVVESLHWHLDVTFMEDGDGRRNLAVAYNFNILRKLALSVLGVVGCGGCECEFV